MANRATPPLKAPSPSKVNRKSPSTKLATPEKRKIADILRQGGGSLDITTNSQSPGLGADKNDGKRGRRVSDEEKKDFMETGSTTPPSNTPPRQLTTTPSPSPPRVTLGISLNDEPAPELHDYLALLPDVEEGPDPDAKVQQRREKRVKVYSLAKASWDDLGTGFCEGRYRMSPEPPDSLPKDPDSTSPPSSPNCLGTPPTLAAQVVVRAEDDLSSLLLNSEVEPWLPEWGPLEDLPDQTEDEKKGERVGRYSRQQDTLIVWNDTNSGMDMALSFATVKGCEEMWEFFLTAQKQVALSLEAAGDWVSDDDLISYSGPSSPMPFNSLFPSIHANVSGTLPDPQLGNIKESEMTVRYCAKSLLYRDKLADWIITSGYLEKLVELFTEAEELESHEDLNNMCDLMHGILSLHDAAIFGAVVSDRLYLPFFGILEYSPAHPLHKANFRGHLSAPNIFKQIEGLPIKDEKALGKIHQTFRLQFLRDMVLGRMADEPVLGVLGSLLFFNQCDIVTHLMNNKEFMNELFNMFSDEELRRSKEDSSTPKNSPLDEPEIGPPVPPSTIPAPRSRRLQAMLFIQQLCQMAKIMQISQRFGLYRNLGELGLLNVVEYGLEKKRETKEWKIALELLTITIDHDSQRIRAMSLKQHSEEKKSLIVKIMDLIIAEQDWGTQLQMMDGLRLLTDLGNEPSLEVNGPPAGPAAHLRLEDPTAEVFMRFFFDECCPDFFSPIKDIQIGQDDNPIIPLEKVNLIAQLCDLACFLITHHGFRAKYFVVSKKLLESVQPLLRAHQKHIRLAALRVYRALIPKNDDFYNRHLVKHGFFNGILGLVEAESNGAGLMLSACLDLFELIKSMNAKYIINHLFDTYRDRLKVLATKLKTFETLTIKWEQLNDSAYQSSLALNSTEEITTTTTPKREISIGAWAPVRRIDADEESYFNDGDDDEEEGTTNISIIGRSGQTSTTGAKKRALDLDDEDEGRKKPRLVITRTSHPNGMSKSQTWPSPNTAKGLVDYADDEDDELAGGFIRETSTPEKVAKEISLRSPSPPPPLLKPGEKRRREEEEEEEESAFGKLAKKQSIGGHLNQTKNSPLSAPSRSPTPTLHNVSTPPGKIKFNLGTKSQIPIRKSQSSPASGGLVLKLKNSTIRKASEEGVVNGKHDGDGDEEEMKSGKG